MWNEFKALKEEKGNYLSTEPQWREYYDVKEINSKRESRVMISLNYNV